MGLFSSPIASPIARRRWKVFRDNRRAFLSMWGLLAMLLISACAPLIANDKPLFIRYEGQSYFPLLRSYSGEDFGFLLPGVDYSSPLLYAAYGWGRGVGDLATHSLSL